jgi:hypothetical protein
MDAWWVCERCHSINRPNSSACYSCRAPKGQQGQGALPESTIGAVGSAASQSVQYPGPFAAGAYPQNSEAAAAVPTSQAPFADAGVPSAIPAPTARTRFGIGSRLFGIFVAVVVFIGLGLVFAATRPNHAGQVVFTTDAPSANGAKTCQIGTQVTSVPSGTAVYGIYFFKSRPTSETLTVTIVKNGAILASGPENIPGVTSVDCVEDTADLSTLGVGTYEIKLAGPSGDVLADGTLTIK